MKIAIGLVAAALASNLVVSAAPIPHQAFSLDQTQRRDEMPASILADQNDEKQFTSLGGPQVKPADVQSADKRDISRLPDDDLVARAPLVLPAKTLECFWGCWAGLNAGLKDTLDTLASVKTWQQRQRSALLKKQAVEREAQVYADAQKTLSLIRQSASRPKVKLEQGQSSLPRLDASLIRDLEPKRQLPAPSMALRILSKQEYERRMAKFKDKAPLGSAHYDALAMQKMARKTPQKEDLAPADGHNRSSMRIQ